MNVTSQCVYTAMNTHSLVARAYMRLRSWTRLNHANLANLSRGKQLSGSVERDFLSRALVVRGVMLRSVAHTTATSAWELG